MGRREESKSKCKKQGIVAKLACEPLRTASSSLEASNNLKVIKKPTIGGQVDGPNDTSDEDDDIDNEEDDDDDDDDDDDEDEDEDEDTEDNAAEEEPLGSGDDISDEDPSDLFNTET